MCLQRVSYERESNDFFFLSAAFCNAHFNFLMTKVGMKIRSAIVTLVYRKTLTLSPKSFSLFRYE